MLIILILHISIIVFILKKRKIFIAHIVGSIDKYKSKKDVISLENRKE